MAFHLGCLRTLDRLGILARARVMSTVSGGSVIGAMYATHEGCFDTFEERVRETLLIGFGKPAIRTVFTTMEGVKAILCMLMLIVVWLILVPVKLVVAGVSEVLGDPRGGGVSSPVAEKWMPRRFASRTTILRHTFDRMLFQGRTLGSLSHERPRFIAVAAELRTGSAFYFGRDEAGCWRFGTMDPSDIPIAQAVAASAAYPLFLPALDEFLLFRRRDRSLVTERVTLTDGGVYDNLGLSPLWPDRDPAISVGVEPIDTIVACRAGYGLRIGNPSIFWIARMKAAFGCTFGRAQNLSMNRLFDLKAAGRLKAFVLPYLDQDDRQLAHPPVDLVRRTAVAGYPTNFSAMPLEWIEKLSKRGEQLTLAVILEHAPHLIPDDRRPNYAG